MAKDAVARIEKRRSTLDGQCGTQPESPFKRDISLSKQVRVRPEPTGLRELIAVRDPMGRYRQASVHFHAVTDSLSILAVIDTNTTLWQKIACETSACNVQ